MLAGAFIVWFWATEIASGATALGGSGAFRFVEHLSQGALNLVADYTEVIAGSFALLIGIAAFIVWRSRGTRPGHDSAGTVSDTIDEAEVVHVASQGG